MIKKYEFVEGDKIVGDSAILTRIRALVDLPCGVSAGDLGGYVESESNLSHEGTCWVGINARANGKAMVRDNAIVTDEAIVREQAIIAGDAKISEQACVGHMAKISGQSHIFGHAMILDRAAISGYAKVFGNALIFGDARVWDYAQVHGRASVDEKAQVWGDANVFDTCTVTAQAQVSGRATVHGDILVTGCSVICGDALVNDDHPYLSVGPFDDVEFMTAHHDTRIGIRLSHDVFSGTPDEFMERSRQYCTDPQTHAKNEVFVQFIKAAIIANPTHRDQPRDNKRPQA